MSERFEPIACSLPLREASSQAGEWHELGGRAIRVERVEDGISVVYPLEMTAQVKDLVAREAACCAWLSLETRRHNEGIQVRLTSPDPDAQHVIEGLVGIYTETGKV